MTLVPPPYLSPSSINTFQQCPLKYKFSKIDGLVEPPTIHTLLGNFVHDILENLYRLPAEQRTLPTARELARQFWDANYQSQAKSLKVVERDFRWKAWWCVENLWKLENPQEVELTGIEHEVYGECEGVTVKGFIDRFEKYSDNYLFIGDYKTGKIPHPNFLDDKFVQLFIYALMLKETGVGRTKKVGLIYLTGPEVMTRNVTRDDLQQTQVLIKSTKSKIDEYCEKEKFPAKPSKLCNWCHFKRICPEWVK